MPLVSLSGACLAIYPSSYHHPPPKTVLPISETMPRPNILLLAAFALLSSAFAMPSESDRHSPETRAYLTFATALKGGNEAVEAPEVASYKP